ncbi:MAG TPA: rhodanese-like domain-containing protein [Epsilonproteobacteria bacterium]|nr:rhodanese-like domain-containing protein [Campylobacterota bacterium]
MKAIVIVLGLISVVMAGKYDKVKITPDMAYIYVYHKGKAVKVHRIQDTKHKLTGEYAKQYRPGKDIQPIKMDPNIQTIGEVELLHFMKSKVNTKKGILVDLRSKRAYREESIPSAVNIPAKTKDSKVKMEKILKVLGAKRSGDGSLDTKKARDVAFYCHGLWCSKSSEMIKTFLELGYPSDKIYYYRGGFQMWKILGFTTVTNQ